jgi:hypothetical protein
MNCTPIVRHHLTIGGAVFIWVVFVFYGQAPAGSKKDMAYGWRNNEEGLTCKA